MNSLNSFPSFAKINLRLLVLGKRPDGFHQLDTILQTISLHDEIKFSPRDDAEVVLHCDDSAIPMDESNLILRAASSLRRETGLKRGANVVLSKQIPAQGGLGGASSNAAATLIALNHLWGLGLDKEQLARIGAGVGSDVPFFFYGGTVRAVGTGTDLIPLPDSSKRYLLVITPNAKVSTRAAYASLKAPSLTTQESVSILSSSFADPSFSDRTQWVLRNDFEGVIFEREPEIKRAKVALLDAGAQGGLLAGSGSSVFGFFADSDACDRGLANLKSENGWQVFSCETISRAEYCEGLRAAGFPL